MSAPTGKAALSADVPRIAPWAARLTGAAVSGSLYAVAAPHRAAAAASLAEEQMAVHVDAIITAAGEHRGVTPTELRMVRRKLPSARVEVHLIVDGGAADLGERARGAVDVVIAAAIETRVDLVVLPTALHRDPASARVALRAAGIAVWSEVAPADRPIVDRAADGALVMLIAPGSDDGADPALVSRVAELSPRMPVGVDGGVTPELAERCIAAGATTIVAGRALFVSAHPGEGEL